MRPWTHPPLCRGSSNIAQENWGPGTLVPGDWGRERDRKCVLSNVGKGRGMGSVGNKGACFNSTYCEAYNARKQTPAPPKSTRNEPMRARSIHSYATASPNGGVTLAQRRYVRIFRALRVLTNLFLHMTATGIEKTM
jgi:hypothetical protein